MIIVLCRRGSSGPPYWCSLAVVDAAADGGLSDFFCATKGCKKGCCNNCRIVGRLVGSRFRQPARTLARSDGKGSLSISGRVTYDIDHNLIMLMHRTLEKEKFTLRFGSERAEMVWKVWRPWKGGRP